MWGSYVIIIVLAVSLFFTTNSAFADTTIRAVENSGANPDCGNSCYSPNTVVVDVGELITMTNADSAGIHTFTSGTVDGFVPSPDGEFDSGILMQGESFGFISNIPDVYPYYCSLHVWMQGTIIVVAQPEEPEVIPPSISAWSDKSSYEEGDIIKISGQVTNPTSTSIVSIIIIAPDGNLVSISQSSLDYNHAFSTTITAGGALMSVSGTYQFDVGYESASDSGTFYFSIPPTPTYPGPAPYGTDVIIARDSSGFDCGNSNSCYSPYRITVDEGETITWYNADSSIHTVSSGTLSDDIIGTLFDSGLLGSGESFSHKFNSPGTFDYFCLVHPWMQGVVSVNKAYTPPTYTPPTYTPPTSDSGHIGISGSSDLIGYEITGGKLFNIIPDVNANALIVRIDATDDGSLTLTIPRSVLDSLLGNGDDDSFFVLIDGIEVDFDEIISSTDRLLTIAFPRGAEDIEIIGTYIVSSYTPPTYTPPTYTPPTYTPPTYTPPTYTPPTYTPPVTVPPGMNIVIPSGTGSPGCENSNSCYEPYTFRAGTRSTITWFNADSAVHTVTSGHVTDNEYNVGFKFDSGLILPGETFSHKFDNAGSFDYFCLVHPWMEGNVIIQRGTTVTSPPPTYTPPTPTPIPTGTISVGIDDSQYSPGELVTVTVSTSQSANVAISVVGPSGDNIVSRSVTTDFRGSGSLQFKLPESSQNGSYRVDSTATISGSKVFDSTTFTVKSTSTRVSIVSLQPTDQQGNVVSSFTKGKLGFVKVILSSDSNVPSLVTINLFDSDLTSLGIGSFKTTLSPGQSEMTLSFFIPSYADSGIGDIYANIFSDWPSQGGVPLTGESSTQVRIQ